MRSRCSDYFYVRVGGILLGFLVFCNFKPGSQTWISILDLILVHFCSQISRPENDRPNKKKCVIYFESQILVLDGIFQFAVLGIFMSASNVVLR